MIKHLFSAALLVGFLSTGAFASNKYTSDTKVKAMKVALNFGLVVNNKHYQIYRSGMLGTSRLLMLKSFLKTQKLAFPKTVIYMNKTGYNGPKDTTPKILNRLFALEEYIQKSTYKYEYYHSFSPVSRTYLDGFNPYAPREDIDASGYLGVKALGFFGKISDGKKDGSVDDFVRIMNLVLKPHSGPTLFHCHGGMHRTGMVGLAIRYLQGGHWLTGPKKTVYALNKTKVLKLTLNPAQYEYYTHNRFIFRVENLKFIEKFSKDPRFKKLDALYGGMLRDRS
ncbi:MAG: hypothetical protein HOE90_23715 [Bacteriovoracaceae bacterium]|jgi:hypothetical protein|nr:hypothetical protein [Bacteriovoracaceae bacterium]